MIPYLLMLALPAFFALMGARASRLTLIPVAFIYWFMIGLRFEVGRDWPNYIIIYRQAKLQTLSGLLFSKEGGYNVVQRFADFADGGIILVNAISALVFCWGFFAIASRCREPFLAICIATPLLVVANAMSVTRQAMAVGIIYFLFATWERRTLLTKMVVTALASLFHFSAILALAFVALSLKASPIVRAAIAGFVLSALWLVLAYAPGAVDVYTTSYVSGPQVTESEGAIIHVLPLAISGGIYLLFRRQIQDRTGRSLLHVQLAIASILAVPTALFISSVGAGRFSLYLWPIAMYVAAALPSLLRDEGTRFISRLGVVAVSFALLSGWLLFANSSRNWLPYQSWVLEDRPGSAYN